MPDVTKVINTIQNITWKGITPLVIFMDKNYLEGNDFLEENIERSCY